MAVFSVNQARHFYVASEVKTPHVVASDATGSIAVRTDTGKTHLYFEYKSADDLVRSDLIDIKNIMYAKATDASDMSRELQSAIVTLDSTVNGGSPVGGQDYILRVVIDNYIGISEDSKYIKYGMVHAYTGMTASKFYVELAKSLVKNFSKDAGLIKVTLQEEVTPEEESGETTEAVPVDVNTKWDTLVGEYSGVIIDEVEQPWKLGTMPQSPATFTLIPTTITVEGDERVWGVVEEMEPSATLNNGKVIADMEYFYMGERGDIYRGIGWPNTIATTYLVDPTKAYHTLDIHYAYVGSNESVQKSEKDITIVASDKTVLNAIIGKINDATSLSIATL